jgi:hypothetical protein
MTKQDILTAVIAILLIDALCLFAWALSGQHPADGFYLGAITKAIINLFI